MKRHFTIGMAGHIDHGKTALTKALTGFDTDRLKEEKERGVSIEPGFAPLELSSRVHASIIDVPGHERFIRQMIAGSSGIDLVVLAVAADEGVMPQTREHAEILGLLGITTGMVAITKAGRVDRELLELAEEDIRDQLAGTVFGKAPVYSLDSVDGTGVEDLRKAVAGKLEEMKERNPEGLFRMPIDQAFSIHGQGTIIRGTIFEGSVKEGDEVEILPSGKKVRCRQIQIHNERSGTGVAGQRAAVNLSGISAEEVQRGDVLSHPGRLRTSRVIDVELWTAPGAEFTMKQRAEVFFYTGTAEVYGKIVFFDRNELSGDVEGERVYCQIRLEHPVTAGRDDRFIIRRPSPALTLGGGTIIDANGSRYRFGSETVGMLRQKMEGSPGERAENTLRKFPGLKRDELAVRAGITPEQTDRLDGVLRFGQRIVLKETFDLLTRQLTEETQKYHEQYPLRKGIPKITLESRLNGLDTRLQQEVTAYGAENGCLIQENDTIRTQGFKPGYPPSWQKRMEQAEARLQNAGLEVPPWDDVIKDAGIPADLSEDFQQFLVREKGYYILDEKHVLPPDEVDRAVTKMRSGTEGDFTLQEAKSVLQVTRKYLVPFLEMLDNAGVTERRENRRVWK
ncbi:selenocysteine-specific translation elongation factor [Alteribacter natronophilus]|uniref:selenocysteine-specific translation elongation factor n=1 Tax=Alteribacter natronophilus TaxID=2583810 RepID=UPI00110ED5DE|nr:selenocysteine-specific translation elongation factor [Alteribacter natronophilus]TMW73322.1 selenocysteine-specific translation elongation factor [Alteribacter natronophilus]